MFKYNSIIVFFQCFKNCHCHDPIEILCVTCQVWTDLIRQIYNICTYFMVTLPCIYSIQSFQCITFYVENIFQLWISDCGDRWDLSDLLRHFLYSCRSSCYLGQMWFTVCTATTSASPRPCPASWWQSRPSPVSRSAGWPALSSSARSRAPSWAR